MIFRSRSLRSAGVAVLLFLAMPAAYAGYLMVSGNIHVVEPGVVYRSGQLDAEQLQNLIDETQIRSILNLRGANPQEAWYRDEKTVAAENGVKSIAIPISASLEPSMATLRQIEAAMRSAPKPLLIHCMSGADRSGLASAIYEYAVAGRPAAAASGQLSIAFGHFPWLTSRTGAMDRAFDHYVHVEDATREPNAGETGLP